MVENTMTTIPNSTTKTTQLFEGIQCGEDHTMGVHNALL